MEFLMWKAGNGQGTSHRSQRVGFLIVSVCFQIPYSLIGLRGFAPVEDAADAAVQIGGGDEFGVESPVAIAEGPPAVAEFFVEAVDDEQAALGAVGDDIAFLERIEVAWLKDEERVGIEDWEHGIGVAHGAGAPIDAMGDSGVYCEPLGDGVQRGDRERAGRGALRAVAEDFFQPVHGLLRRGGSRRCLGCGCRGCLFLCLHLGFCGG